MAVASEALPQGPSCKVLPGGGNGFRLDVKAQHPALFAHKAAEKSRGRPVAAGGIDAEPGVSQPRGEEVLHKLHGRQVGGAAAAQPAALCRKTELCPEGLLPRSAGRGAVNTVASLCHSRPGCAIPLLTGRNRNPCAAIPAQWSGQDVRTLLRGAGPGRCQ